MKKGIQQILSISLLTLALTTAVGCGAKTTNATKTPAKTEKAQEVKTKDFKSPDGKLQITIPENWKQLDELKQINDKVSVAVGNKPNEEYATVISESKENFSKDMSLNQYYDIISKQLKKQITNAEISDVKDSEINGCKAKTFKIKGEVQNIKVSYIYGIIESPNSYNQVVTWTLTTKFDKNKDQLTKVIESFKELSK